MMSQRDCHLEDNLELGVNQVERRLASVEVEQYKICTGSDRLQSQVVTYKIMQQWRWWIFTLRTIEHGIQDLRCAQSQGDVSDDQGVSSCQLKQHRHQLLLFFAVFISPRPSWEWSCQEQGRAVVPRPLQKGQEQPYGQLEPPSLTKTVGKVERHKHMERWSDMCLSFFCLALYTIIAISQMIRWYQAHVEVNPFGVFQGEALSNQAPSRAWRDPGPDRQVGSGAAQDQEVRGRSHDWLTGTGDHGRWWLGWGYEYISMKLTQRTGWMITDSVLIW